MLCVHSHIVFNIYLKRTDGQAVRGPKGSNRSLSLQTTNTLIAQPLDVLTVHGNYLRLFYTIEVAHNVVALTEMITYYKISYFMVILVI